MGVASCTRPREHQYNMVTKTTLVVFTIVLAVTGVFVPEAGKELEESDRSQNSLNYAKNLVDVQESVNSKLRLKRDAGEENIKGEKKRKKKKAKKRKAKRTSKKKNNHKKNNGKKVGKKRTSKKKGNKTSRNKTGKKKGLKKRKLSKGKKKG